MVGDENLVYSRGVLSAEQLQSEITHFWHELETNTAIEGELKASGINLGLLSETERTNAITVDVGASGVDPTATLLIITFAPAANRALKDLWTTVLLPRIRRRWGDDAVGDESRSGNR